MRRESTKHCSKITSRLTKGVLGVAIFAVALYCLDARATTQSCAEHGIPQNGFPNWQERATLVVTNTCRMAPQAFRATYMPTVPTIMLASNYPPVAPLQWRADLNHSARAHSIDVATTPGCAFQHNSCDGTTWGERVFSYYDGAIGENMAGGFYNPLSMVIGLLADPHNGAPAPDFSGYDGHRRNIMEPIYTELGVGFAAGPNEYQRYWTQDFGHPTIALPICSPLIAASHIFDDPPGTISFLANFYDADGIAPQSAVVIVDGTAIAMVAYLGSPARGTYRYVTEVGTGCRPYHFEFRDHVGVNWRYPVSGDLATFGEGSCTTDFVPSDGTAPTPTPRPSPTPTPTPTPAPRPSPTPTPEPTAGITSPSTPSTPFTPSAPTAVSSTTADPSGLIAGCSAAPGGGGNLDGIALTLGTWLLMLTLRRDIRKSRR